MGILEIFKMLSCAGSGTLLKLPCRAYMGMATNKDKNLRGETLESLFEKIHKKVQDHANWNHLEKTTAQK